MALGRSPEDKGDNKVMPHTKYRSSMLYTFSGEDFYKFCYISLCKTDKPSGRGHFLSQDHNFNNFFTGP